MTQSGKVTITGLDKLIRGLRNNAEIARPLSKAFHTIGLELSSESKAKAPHNFGQLQDSITYQIDPSPLPLWVRVGTIGGEKPNYAAWMEYGTGRYNDHPSWPKKRVKRPPIDALIPYVIQKGRYRGETAKKRKARIDQAHDAAAALSFSIWLAGGLKPRRFIRDPFEKNKAKYTKMIQDVVKGMNIG